MRTQVHGGDIYTKPYRLDFSANMNPLGMPAAVERAACEGVRRSGNYPDVECRGLREAISRGEGVPAEWIVCGNGAAELIFALAWAARPKKALLVSPGFAEYEQALRSVDCQIEFYQCQEERGFVLEEDYLSKITEDTEILFLCNPNNPTGLLIDPVLLERVARRCQEQRVLMVLDECFNGLLARGEELSRKQSLEQEPRLFLLRAFTKLYAMAGLRLGYGLCSDTALLERVRAALQPWNVSLPAQMAGVAAMAEQDYVRRSRAYIAKERAFLRKNLCELGLKVYDSQANYLFFQGPEDLGERCASEGILIRDCSNYRGLGPGYFRVAVRTHEENLELLMALRKYQKA